MEGISPYKSFVGHSKKASHHFVSGHFPIRSSNFQEKGVSQASPPFLSRSYPQFPLQQQPSAPLYPYPAGNHGRRAAAGGLSLTPNNRKIGNIARSGDSTLTPKKVKSSNYPKNENDVSSPKKPSPIRLPENGRITILSDANNPVRSQKHSTVDRRDKFSGSVTFAGSPPPSSLPLPTFSLRPKLSCMVEAAGIDSGATDSLRRLLRIL
ncbi:hypothetical protein F511_18180 [Dorcoceras hygrometricum]|uniref:Uncharacterized protein n=1 Tax=Dorcoceras hygrometricum TaxID=472368 RepID=A0A2Z7BFG0_9LAMI|nr:hypothetical protein F511_18180 [Dorcoceras hygrometricum]